MDPSCLNNEVESLVPSATSESKTLDAGGNSSKEKPFLCLICNKSVLRFQGIPMHITSQQHFTELEKLSSICEEVDDHFACKLCNNYVAADWKAFIIHYNEKQHADDLKNEKAESSNTNSQDSNFSYIPLVLNQIIEIQLGAFFCCCCKSISFGRNLVAEHIAAEEHTELQRTRHGNIPITKWKESDCRRWAKNFIFHVSSLIFKCNLCNVTLKCVGHCFEHLQSVEHATSIFAIDNIGQQFIPQDSQTTKNPQIQIPKVVQDETLDFSPTLMRDNYITGPSGSSNMYTCKLCSRKLFTPKTIMAHVMGNQHRKSMADISNQTPSATGSEEPSDDSSSSWETEDTSESWETYDGESQSYDSYENSSYSWESSENVSDSWETINIESSGSERQGSALFEVPQDLIPLIAKHSLQHLEKELFCTLCEAHLQSPQSILAHTRSKYHVAELNKNKAKIAKQNSSNKKPSPTANKNEMAASQQRDVANKPKGQQATLFAIPKNLLPLISKHMLEHKTNEIYCVACDAHLQNPQSLIAHTQSRYHVAELNIYKAKIARQNSINKKPATKTAMGTSLQKNVAKKSEAPQSTWFEIPKSLLPLIPKHMLQHKAKEIYCVACDAHLKSPECLVAHTKSRYHVAELNIYKAEIARKEKKVATTASGRNSVASSVSDTVSKKKPSQSNDAKHGVSIGTQKPGMAVTKPPQSKSIKIPDYLIPMLAAHSLQHLGHEILCIPCQVHSEHLNTLIEHISGKKHMAKLYKYRAEVLNEGGSLATTSKTDAATNSFPVNVENEKPSNIKRENDATSLKIVTANPPNSQPRLMEIPPELVPLIAMHSLQHLEKEIYCAACRVHIKHVSSLVSHTNSSRHAAALKMNRACPAAKNMETQISSQIHVSEARRAPELMKETSMDKVESDLTRSTSASDNIACLEDALNKLRVAEEKGKNSKRSKNFRNPLPKQRRPLRQLTRLKKSCDVDPKYLEIDMQHIYVTNPDKLRIMELSCQLCFPKTANEIYCLICERSVPSKSQSFYEHIYSTAHTVYLAEAEQNDRHFTNYPDQFSDLTLAKEYMQETPEQTIQCFACDVSIKSEDPLILEHIREDSHKERKQLWKEAMDEKLQKILAENESTWYNIQKYWCQPCDIEYNTEFYFAEHMDSKKHINNLKKIGAFQDRLVYNSCIPCAMLWLGFAGIYTQHCEQPMHKYLVQSGDFSVCKLPYQAITLLENAEAEVTHLIELSDQVSTVEKVKADSLLKCLEDTVSAAFANAKAYPFGSRVSGLGFPDSDIDVFLDCGTYDGIKTSDGHQRQLLIIVEECLNANQQSWEIEETLATSRTPIIKLRHRETELSCDVSFKNGLSVENTKLLKCFIDNYPLCRKLMLFIKKWLSSCNLSGSQYITNYAMCWYVIFYLQSESILPSIASLIAKENKSKIIDGWETGVSETFDVGGQERTFTELLRGFFTFYNKFDYRHSVACPLLGSTVPKKIFTKPNLNLLPQEMAPYVDHIKAINGPVELFRIDSEMCIQDPYDLSHNLTKAVRKFTLNRFKRLCATSADVLNNLTQH